jgi:hypothetical protein
MLAEAITATTAKRLTGDLLPIAVGRAATASVDAFLSLLGSFPAVAAFAALAVIG